MKKLTSLLTLLIVLSLYANNVYSNPTNSNGNFLVEGAYWITEETEFDENGDVDPEWTTIDSTWIGAKTTFNGKEVFPMLANSTDEDGNPIVDSTFMFFSGMKLYASMNIDDNEDNPLAGLYNSLWICLIDFGTSNGDSWLAMEVDTTITIAELGGDVAVKMTMEISNVGSKNIVAAGETIATTGFETKIITIMETVMFKYSTTETTINYFSYTKGAVYSDDKGGISVYEVVGQKEEEIIYGGESKLLRYYIPGSSAVNNYINNSKLDLTLSPNPASSILNIQTNINNIELIEIIDYQGNRISRILNPMPNSKINVSNLENGYYFLRVTRKNSLDNQSKSFIINR